jgi:GTP 3',8-cyclase
MMPANKPELHLRISVTDRCQLRCGYCMPPEGIVCGTHESIMSFEEILQFVTWTQEHYRITKIRLTGGEPLIRPDIVKLVAMLAERQIPELALTTNGLRLPDLTGPLKAAGLHRVNISLDALSPDCFARITRGGDVADVLKGIEAARAAGLAPIKLNTVAICGENDAEWIPILQYAIQHGYEARFIECMPIGPGTEIYKDGFISSEDLRNHLAQGFTLTPLPYETGTSARRYQVTDSNGHTGVVGFISSCSAPFCSGCKRLRITSGGELIGCLAREKTLPIRNMLQSGDKDSLQQAIVSAMGGKRTTCAFAQERTMARIGG